MCVCTIVYCIVGNFPYGANFCIFHMFHLYAKIKTCEIFTRGLDPSTKCKEITLN